MKFKRHYSIEAFISMIAFGLVIGIIFPIVVNPFVEWIPGMKKYFIILCLVAGLLVGANSFAIAWAVLLRRVKAMADSLSETAIREGDLTFRIPEVSGDLALPLTITLSSTSLFSVFDSDLFRYQGVENETKS